LRKEVLHNSGGTGVYTDSYFPVYKENNLKSIINELNRGVINSEGDFEFRFKNRRRLDS